MDDARVSEWSPGSAVLLRQLFLGRIWNATPATVVRDGDPWTVLWLPPGVAGKRGEGDILNEWKLVDVTWRSRPHGILRVSRRREPRSTLFMWDDDGEFQGWYVNLERPLVRTRLGFDFDDRLLDLWIDRDGASRWVDTDEFERARERGLIGDVEAESIVQEGHRALADFTRGAPPFRIGWESWRPDAEWTLPTLPHGWDVLTDREGGCRATG
jgi:hypothetical protein